MHMAWPCCPTIHSPSRPPSGFAGGRVTIVVRAGESGRVFNEKQAVTRGFDANDLDWTARDAPRFEVGRDDDS